MYWSPKARFIVNLSWTYPAAKKTIKIRIHTH